MEGQLKEILRFSPPHLSNMKPSDWAEKYRVMSAETSPYPGKFSYKWTPYCKEIVDCLSPDHPARIVTVMKGSQLGFSTGVIETGIGWIISQNPGNILLAARDESLVKKMMNTKIDPMIDSSNLRHLIRPNVIRKKNQRTGDTDLSKEYSGGVLSAFSIQNPGRMRQISAMYGFLDDFEAAKADKDAGSASALFETRFGAGYGKMKLFYISTPEIKQSSNIEPLYERGDERKYHVPCPCCGDFITYEWSFVTETGDKAGITWKVDDKGRLQEGSVGYICQSCGGFFTEKGKNERNMEGVWIPTSESFEPGNYSYHISNLYSPSGMTPWDQYVRDYLKCFPEGGKPDIDSYKTFVNTALGLTWEEKGKEVDAKGIMLNTRDYKINEVPSLKSQRDSNGMIIAITCAADMNGLVDDARLDYEVVGWSANGSSYSINHGSIGTFVPREKTETEREKLSYDIMSPNSVWEEFKEVLTRKYLSDDGRELNVNFAGLDTGHYTVHAYSFIDSFKGFPIVGVKGWADKIRREDVDKAVYRQSRERDKLFILDVNKLKDLVSEYMDLKWMGDGTDQPAGFMNFPEPSEGKYTYNGYFKHYEAEKRVVDRNKGVIWVKQNSAVQNHFFDCRVYNYAMREIMAYYLCKENKIPNPSYDKFVDILLGNI